jgi:hypothetical protein
VAGCCECGDESSGSCATELVSLVNKNRENEMDEMNRGHERDEKCVHKFDQENLKERHLLAELCTDGRVLFNWVKETRYDVIAYIN